MSAHVRSSILDLITTHSPIRAFPDNFWKGYTILMLFQVNSVFIWISLC